MMASVLFYASLVTALVGAGLVVHPVPGLGVESPVHAATVMAVALGVAIVALVLPSRASRVDGPVSRLDAFMPAWHFGEIHRRRIAARPERVYDAILEVRPDEIALYPLLAWIRRGGRGTTIDILNPDPSAPILRSAIQGGFVQLADNRPHELVVGAVIVDPREDRRDRPVRAFVAPPPGAIVAMMNFSLMPEGDGGTLVTTETRVFANGDVARRRFGAYWHVIYPGSALIRRMWLRAIERRAVGARR